MKRAEFAQYLEEAKILKQKNGMRSFAKSYMFDMIYKSFLIILDQILETKEKCAVARSR